MKQALSSEAKIERWIRAKGRLGSERLLVLRTQRPIRRVVDVLALDNGGKLVFIEIKNETSNRRAVGQVLEYLWLYKNATLDELAEEFAEANPTETRSLAKAYQEAFGKSLEWRQALRFVIVAPAFHVNTTFGVRYLRDLAKQDCALVKVTEHRGRFAFAKYELPDYVRAGSLFPGAFGMSRSRVVRVLVGGHVPVLWTVGRRSSSGGIKLMAQQTLSKSCVQLKNRTVIPVPQPPEVSMERSGTIWFRTAKPRWAVLIGIVEAAKTASHGIQRHCVCAMLRDGKFEKFRVYGEHEFRDQWKVQKVNSSFSWRGLVTGAVVAPV